MINYIDNDAEITSNEIWSQTPDITNHQLMDILNNST